MEKMLYTVTKNKAASDYAMLATWQNSVFLWGMVKHGTRKKSRELDLNNKTMLSYITTISFQSVNISKQLFPCLLKHVNIKASLVFTCFLQNKTGNRG